MMGSGFRVVSGDGETIEKDALGVLDYGVDWTQWLKAGETISNSAWEVPATITLEASPAPGINAGITFLWLSGGGAIGVKHFIRNTITTNQGRTEVRSFTIIISKR